MHFFRVLRIAGLVLLLGMATAVAADYKVGERLPRETPDPASGPYRALNWDELMPADWDPMAAFKGIDLDQLEDSDPRAIEALEKVRLAWNNAPIVPALNRQRVEIPGFVVPLDADPQRVQEFLLVPYFGACIHVPPPPGNQVIHIIPPTTLPKEQRKVLKDAFSRYGAISVSGLLETVSSDTPMGFAGYRIRADRLDLYKPPAN